MSKSGIPVVSQAAETVHTLSSSIGDVLSGKNVFEATGRIIAAPIAANADLLNDISFHKLEKAQLGVGDFLKTGSEFSENPYDKTTALKFGKASAVVGAETVGAIYGGPLIAETLGVGSGVGTGLAISASGKIAKGENVLDSLSPLATQGITNYIGSETGIDVKPFMSTLNSKPSGFSPSSQTYSNNVIGGPDSGSGSLGSSIFIMIVAVFILFFVIKAVRS